MNQARLEAVLIATLHDARGYDPTSNRVVETDRLVDAVATYFGTDPADPDALVDAFGVTRHALRRLSRQKRIRYVRAGRGYVPADAAPTLKERLSARIAGADDPLGVWTERNTARMPASMRDVYITTLRDDDGLFGVVRDASNGHILARSAPINPPHVDVAKARAGELARERASEWHLIEPREETSWPT